MRAPGALLLVLIVVLGVGGYLLTSTTIRDDRDTAAERRARVEAVHAQEVLGRARAYVAGLADVLAREPEPGQPRFARWAGATSASVGLNDVLWVESVPASERRRYERLRGVPITRLMPSGRTARAAPEPSYLPATFTSQTRAELRPGVDVTGFPGLGPAIRDRARIFAVGASPPGALGGEPGFYLLEAAAFASRPGSRGYLVAFVPRGWFSTTLGGDPRRVAISEDGRRIEGRLGSVHASAGFEMLGRHWRIDVGREPPTGLQSLLPWLALAWPFAVAGIVLAIGRAITQRRRAQREVERIFDLSLDMIATAGFDGRFRAVNPAFERTLGYTREQMIGRAFLDFVHPDDRETARQVFAEVLGGVEANQFENRYVCADGSGRWLQWNVRAVPEQDVVYGIARDVTERRRIDAEQAALRRVATLVAREAPQAEVFSVIAEEIGRLIGTEEIRMLRFDGDGGAVVVGSSGSHKALPLGSRQSLEGDSAAARVQRTGNTARIDDYAMTSGPLAESVQGIGVRSAVAAPILVEGRLWGTIVAGATRDESLPPETESRLGQFTELVATAIANAESRAEVERLAEEQAALRRVATVVARGGSRRQVFNAIAEEVRQLVGTDFIDMLRYEDDRTAVSVASGGIAEEAFAVGSHHELGGDNATTRIMRTGKPVRIDDYDRTATGPIAEAAHPTGIRSVVGTPLVVDGRLWGAVTIGTTAEDPLPPHTESRLGQFTELLSTAIANTEARAEVERLAEEQAALRRVATLVAEGAAPTVVLDAVAAEMERLLGADGVTLSRYELADEVTVVAHRGSDARRVPPGTRVSHRGENVTSIVRRSERAARLEHERKAPGAFAEFARAGAVRASVGAPIVVDGRLWGVAVATWRGAESPPPDTEERMAKFAELLDSAIANTDSRDQLNASRARLVTEADDARRRVVRDLHDGAQQRLVHTIVTLKVARRALREEDGNAKSAVDEALEQAQQANAALRDLAHGILPAVLTRGGLQAGVDAVVSRLDLPVHVDVPDERFPAEIEASAYFIVAEALTNVVKHARAQGAEVRASVENGILDLEVHDDGIGGADRDGHGLVGMDDRVTALGGRLDIESRPGRGTVVHATLPLRQ